MLQRRAPLALCLFDYPNMRPAFQQFASCWWLDRHIPCCVHLRPVARHHGASADVVRLLRPFRLQNGISSLDMSLLLEVLIFVIVAFGNSFFVFAIMSVSNF